ncbi:MAG: radical SAM family heme chaperone HemW [Oscillospiraceae bacterium]|nr:radical SAM family heme chaperone HemW [Oscillospiraceae bacterium]
MNELKPLGIYIHIPFCRSKCQYCDFYSIGGSRDRRLVDNYLQALSEHFKETGALATDYVVDTVYFGGGTPSFFGVDNLRRIFAELQHRFRVDKDAEITFEANPDSVSTSLLRKLRAEGFNRISLGVQSDQDDMLQKLGRPHTYEQAQAAFQQARECGFDNISLDLMYGLPNQTSAQWEQTLTHVLDLRPDHMSCYGLKVEPNTPLWEYRDAANLPSDEVQADMYLNMVEILEAAGYQQYEISNFAKPGYESRHNLKYWLGEEYIGFGPAASSDFAGKRFTNNRDIQNYIRGVLKQDVTILSECETIPAREHAGEYVMLRLRTTQGISPDEYEKRYLMPFAPLLEAIEPLAARELFVRKDGRWVLTPRGFLVSNQIIVCLQEAQEASEPLAKKR